MRSFRPIVSLLSLAVAVVVVGVFVAAYVRPAAAKPKPATKFVSKLYGYSLVLPGSSADWLSSLATVDWSSGSIEHGSPEFDTFTDLQNGRIYFLAAAQAGSSLKQWTQFVASARPSVCGTARSLGSSTLSEAQARILTWTSQDGYKVFAITALHARRGYVLLVASVTTLSPAADRQAFDTARHGFRFQPARTT